MCVFGVFGSVNNSHDARVLCQFQKVQCLASRSRTFHCSQSLRPSFQRALFLLLYFKIKFAFVYIYRLAVVTAPPSKGICVRFAVSSFLILANEKPFLPSFFFEFLWLVFFFLQFFGCWKKHLLFVSFVGTSNIYSIFGVTNNNKNVPEKNIRLNNICSVLVHRVLVDAHIQRLHCTKIRFMVCVCAWCFFFSSALPSVVLCSHKSVKCFLHSTEKQEE